MIQFARPLDGVALCGEDHKPQLVETRGAPHGHRTGTPCPHIWHVECWACGTATVPTVSRAMAESRWHSQNPLHLISISDLGRERTALAASLAA